MREEENKLFLDNIYKSQEDGLLLKEFDKKIVNSPYFETIVRDSEFKNLEELNLFFKQLEKIFNTCQKNDINENSLFPIDPNTGENIDINNLYIYKDICYNTDITSADYKEKTPTWKKLLSIADSSLMFISSDVKINLIQAWFILKIINYFN